MRNGSASMPLALQAWEGPHILAQGAFAGIRNVASDAHDACSEQEDLERLAVLPVMDRRAGATEPVEGPTA